MPRVGAWLALLVCMAAQARAGAPLDDTRSALFQLRASDLEAQAYVQQVLAAPGTPRRVRLESTLGWGCPCPAWAFPFHRQLRDLRHVMVVPAPGLALDPNRLARPGVMVRMQGHFSGETLTGLEWVQRLAAAPPGFPGRPGDDDARREYWSAPGPVFVVRRWCFETPLAPADRRWLERRGARRCRSRHRGALSDRPGGRARAR